jgi:hypothetical protein
MIKALLPCGSLRVQQLAAVVPGERQRGPGPSTPQLIDPLRTTGSPPSRGRLLGCSLASGKMSLQ